MIEINGKRANEAEAKRVHAVTNRIRNLARNKEHFRLSSFNSLKQGKGLGFSASAFAAIALASCGALGLRMEPERMSEIARLGAGSASRSLVGGFSIWYANRNGRSYAKQLSPSGRLDLAMAVVPIPSAVKTEMAHEESVSSPYFGARLVEVKGGLRGMLRAIHDGDLDELGRLTEAESLSLHAVTMTGKAGLVLMAPETIRIMECIRAMRENDSLPVWFSLDTGPSVYVNTHEAFIDEVCKQIRASTNLEVMKSKVGGPAHTVEEYLF